MRRRTSTTVTGLSTLSGGIKKLPVGVLRINSPLTCPSTEFPARLGCDRSGQPIAILNRVNSVRVEQNKIKRVVGEMAHIPSTTHRKSSGTIEPAKRCWQLSTIPAE